MTTQHEFSELIEQFIRVNNELTQIQKKPIVFPGDITLNTGAVHLIEAIGKHPLSNTTQLATILGLTKGAISQHMPRLEKQGLITKTKKENNKKETYFSLTDKGSRIYDYHTVLHNELYTHLMTDLMVFSPQEITLIKQMLHRISTSITEYQHLLTPKTPKGAVSDDNH